MGTTETTTRGHGMTEPPKSIREKAEALAGEEGFSFDDAHAALRATVGDYGKARAALMAEREEREADIAELMDATGCTRREAVVALDDEARDLLLRYPNGGLVGDDEGEAEG